jgi:hypothetical protein
MKKTARNDITGDFIASRPNSEQFEKNFDLIFRNKKRSDDVSPHLHEYELNKSTGEVQKVDHGDTTNTQE